MLRQAIFSFFAFFVILASSWALLTPKFFRVHDYVHAARIAELVRAVSDGHLPVRWSEHFGYGYGMPLFEFYAPLPFYVGGFFYWLGVDVVTSIKLLYVLSSLGAFVGAYLVVSRLAGRVGGTVTGTLYALAPYRAMNLFVRGALSEAWGMMWLPWVLLGVVMIWRREKNGWLVLAFATAALFLSHNLSALMFLPLVGLWCASILSMSLWQNRIFGLRRWWQSWKQILAEWVGGIILGTGLAAFYILPALQENRFTKIDSILGGYFHYSQHFLYLRQFLNPGWGFGGSEWGPNDGISFFLGWGIWLGVGVIVLLVSFFISRWYRFRGLNTVKAGQARIWQWILTALGLASIALFMTLQRSAFIWDRVPALAIIQFPWRWLGPAHFWLALAVGCAIGLIRPKLFRLAAGWGFVAIVLATHWWYFRPESYLDNADALYYTDAERIQSEMSGILPDYIPKQMPEKLTPPNSLFLVPEGTEKHVEVLVDRTHQKLLKTSFISPVVMNIQIADFPGWTIELDGQKIDKLPGQAGTLAVGVPAGEHLVGVLFGGTPVRNWGDWLSTASFLVLVAFWLRPSLTNEPLRPHTKDSKGASRRD